MKAIAMIVGLICAIGVGGVQAKATVLERDEVARFVVTSEPSNSSNSQRLHLRGCAMHSALNCGKIVAKRSKGELNYRVSLTASRGKGNGQLLDYELVIPDGVKRVTFGKKQTVIWPTTVEFTGEEMLAYEAALQQFRTVEPRFEIYAVSVVKTPDVTNGAKKTHFEVVFASDEAKKIFTYWITYTDYKVIRFFEQNLGSP